LIKVFDSWIGLDVRQLAAFTSVAEMSSFAAAAHRLGYTQPAISHQVATLERVVGYRLFERGRGRSAVTLTEAGKLFRAHLDLLGPQLSAARADLETLAAAGGGVVRVGAFQSISARIIPALVDKLAATTPNLTVELTEGADETELLHHLANAELDFAFTILPISDSRFTAVELLEDPYFLAGSEGTVPAIETLRDLENEQLVASRSCRSSEMIDAQIRGSGVEPHYVFRTDDNLALAGLLQRGLGLAFVTRLILDTLGDGIDAMPVGHLIPPRRIAVAWSASRQHLPVRQQFLDVARATCADLVDGLDTPGQLRLAS
jgi:DNA-binding transcriptional LysR family regulator